MTGMPESKDTRKSILLISSDGTLKADIEDNLALQGYRVSSVATQGDALKVLERGKADIVILDLEKTGFQEMSLVHYVKTRPEDIELVVLATVKELEEARNAVRGGASFYLIKPIAFHDLKQVLDKLARRLEEDQARVKLELRVLEDLMAGSPAMEKLLALSLKIAPTVSTVLIGGESGTGKEFFARVIYRMSRRHDGAFVPVNCGAIPDTLFESELFGHRKGSFTGADRDRPGLVEEAHMGTLFLDEVGELSPAAQVKLLRFLQERTFKRVGENTIRTVDVRIIAATNKDLLQRVREGLFREDLFYRLNVFYLHLPPLRQRRETLPALLKVFIHRYNQVFDKHITRISRDAEIALMNYEYPGNVRELENIIEHAVVLAEGNEIRKSDLPEFMGRGQLLLT
ncbi:MAG: response regulator, partial [Chitinivibrionales bacterium]|nr:response regulator [Chitinivibrionales bacterium]